MWPSEKMKFSPYVIISILLLTFLCVIKCEISDQRLCGDPECLDPVSTGRTIIDYPSSGSGILSFKKNVKVLVISKSAGSRPDLWGVEINGKRGYVPKTFIREDKILKKKLEFMVSTSPEKQNDHADSDISNEKNTIKIPVEKMPELSASIKNTDTTLPKATESLPENPINIAQSSEEIIKDLDPASSNYEVIGDTTIYYSTENDKEVDHLTPEPKDITKELDSADNVTNITTSVSVTESVEIHSNIRLETSNVGESVADKLDVNSGNKYKILIENTVKNENEVPIKQDNNNLEALTENILNNGVNVSSENSLEDQNDSNEMEANLVDGKLNLNLDNLDNLNLDNLDKLNLNIDLADPIKFLDQSNTEKQINIEGIDRVQPNHAEETPKTTEENNVNNDGLKASEFVEKNVPHNHNIINNYLFKNHNVLNDNSNKIAKEDDAPEEQQSGKIVKRDISEQITNTEALLPVINSDIADPKTEIPNANDQIQTFSSETQMKSEVPQENSKINSVSDFHFSVPTEVSDLSNKNINSEIPKLNNEAPELNTDVPASDHSVLLNIETISYTNSLPSTDLPSNTEEPTVNTELPLNSNIFANKEHSVTENPYNIESVLEGQNKDLSAESVNYEATNDLAYPPFKELSGDILTNSYVTTTIKSVPDVIIDTSEQLTEKSDGITKNVIKESLPIGHVEEIRYDSHISDSQQLEKEETINDVPVAENNFVDWMYGMIFGSSENKENVEQEIENNLNELDNRHDGLLSRFPNDKGVCTDENSDCLASDVFTKSPSEKESFTDSIIYDITKNSGTTFVYLSVTAITVLVFTLGYYYIETWRQDGSLLRKVNTLEQALMVSTKECEILKEDLGATKIKLTSIKEGAFGSNEEVISLQEDKKKLEMTIVEKERQLLVLQKEFESATETGLELNKMLHDMMLTAQKGDTIAESMEQAQLQLNEQKETINSMSNALSARSRENSTLQLKLKEHESQIECIQKLLEDEMSSNKLLQDERVKMEEQLQSLKVQLSKFEEENSYEILQVRSELSETQRDLYAKASQVQLLEGCIKTLKSGKSVDISDLADIAKLQSDLQRVTEELNSLRENSKHETEAKKKREENIKSLENQISALHEDHHRAEKDKLEAQTRLEVLSGYFKEKETQLQKELGIQEALWQQKQGEATSTVERLHSMQDEIQSLKSQNQSLRTEIEQQASAHRSQVTTLESRVHEAWLSSRQAQRKLEESRQEASTLRRKLTSLVEQENMQKRGSSPLEVQLSAASPIHMNSAVSPILPPPPLPYLPPPFLPPPIGAHPPPPPHFMPPFMGDMRPPPLGRLPSPPRQRRGHYSPSMASERYSPESRAYSPESRAYSPDSRAYSPDYRRPISPYDTETDISPPGSPYRNKYNSYSNRRDEQRRLSKGVNSAESTETINRNGRNHTTSAV